MQKGALVPLTHFYIYITLTYLQRFVNHFFNKIFKKYLKIKQEKNINSKDFFRLLYSALVFYGKHCLRNCQNLSAYFFGNF